MKSLLFKRVLLLLILLSIFEFSFSQKSYRFDYLLEYEIYNYKDSISMPKYYLTNSLDNSYFAVVTKKNKKTFIINFTDYNGVSSTFELDKDNLFKEEPIIINRDYIKKFTYSKKKNKRNKMKFKILKDTVIEQYQLKHYKFYSTDSRKSKRKKLREQHYYIDDNDGLHLPILDNTNAFDVWNLDGNISKSIYRFKYEFNYLGEVLFKEKLKQITRIKKILLIEKT